MVKMGFWEDTFEKLAELGVSTAKKSAQSVKQTFSPLKNLEKTINPQSPQFLESPQSSLKETSGKGKNHTPLNFQKLQKKYEDQDQVKTKMLRQRLFQLVKSGEEKSVMKMRQKEMEKKRKEQYEVLEKKRKEQEKKKRESIEPTPMGKIRRSIFSPKKVAKREQAEVRPAAGKQ